MVRTDPLIPIPPQMEDAIFGVNNDTYIREVRLTYTIVLVPFTCILLLNFHYVGSIHSIGGNRPETTQRSLRALRCRF